MSKHNKVNKSNYDQGGRLTPDEMARERMKQAEAGGRAREHDHPSGTKGPIPGERESSRPRSAPEE
jgi:hypothetical protein